MAIWVVRLCEANLQQVQSRAEGLGEEHIHLQKQSITTVRVRVGQCGSGWDIELTSATTGSRSCASACICCWALIRKQ